MVIQVDLATAMDRSSRYIKIHQVVEKVVLGPLKVQLSYELYGQNPGFFLSFFFDAKSSSLDRWEFPQLMPPAQLSEVD